MRNRSIRHFATRVFAAAAFALLAGDPHGARADVVELANGSIVQGRIVDGKTTEEGLAVELYETGGVVVIRWDHILASRAKELKVRTGIEAPEEDAVRVPGHTVLLATGDVLQGLVLNLDAKGEAVKLKTASGVREYDRTQVQRTDATELDGLAVYTADELYQWLRDQAPPDSPAAHKALGLQAMRIGALAKAREHLTTAKADAAFAQTTEGRSLDAVLRQLEVLEKSAGAQAMKRQIEDAKRQNRWNEALAKVAQLDEQFKDEQVRKAIGFSVLENSVVRGRDAYFSREVQKRVYSTMSRLIDKKCSERKPSRVDPDQPRGVATPGTLAAARQWASKDLPKEIWSKVGEDLGLTPDEMDRYWKERSGRNTQNANYGTGSFIVVKRAASTSRANDPGRQRRPPGSSRSDDKGGPKTPAKEDKPKTEEEWWDLVGPGDRARWLTAFFVESSGIFEITRADEGEMCGNCGGKGSITSNNSDGSQSSTVCTTCNGAAKVRKVTFR